MALEMLKCPNCGARVPASLAGSVAPCDFCGAVLSGLGLAPAPVPAPAPTPAAAPEPAPVVARRPEKLRSAARPAAATWTEADLLALARRRLGTRDSLYFDGSIPEKKLNAALETHGKSIGRVLVQYDDTLFGGADDGFVLTGTALHWKNLAEEPQAVRWSDLDPATLGTEDSAVKVGSQKIDLVLEQGQAMIAELARLIADLAAWAHGHGPPND